MMLTSTRIDEQGNIRFRITIVFILVLVLCAIIVGRLFQKQIVQHDHYETLAYNQRYKEEKIPSARGEIFVNDIYSDNLYPLVTNKTFWAVLVVPNQVTDPDKLATGLGPIIGVEPVKILQLLSENKLYIQLKL